MILADKIITLRKKNGWSQEDLAEKVNVSRQAVSKWEGAQTIPDLDKILQLSKVFGVSTDYLIKDEIEIEEYTEMGSEETERKVHKVTMEEANRFLDVSKANAPKIALGVFLCVISPITLLLLGGASDCGVISMSENQAGGIGLVVLIGLVAIAVGLFLTSGMKTKEFEYLEKEVIETEYGVTGMVKERKEQYKDKYATSNIIGTILCILSVVPIFAGIIISENDFLMVSAVCVLLLFVAIGCLFFVNAGCTQGSMEKLLQEGDYTKDNKQANKKLEAISGLYWSLIVAAYLAVSFITMRWDMTWIIWPVAGVLFGAVRAIMIIVHKD